MSAAPTQAPAAAPPPISDNVRGMAWMLVTAFVLTVTSAIVKQLGQTLPVAEIVCFRMGLGALLILPVAVRGGWSGLATRRLRGHFWRAVTGIAAFVLVVYALSHLMLANATALGFSTPLWMIVVSRLTIGERAGWARGLATVVGFAGIVIIARPDVEITLPAIAALAGAFLVSLAMIQVRQLSATESPFKLAFYLQAFGALFTAPSTMLGWQSPTPGEWGLLLGVGLVGTIGLFCQARAYGSGEPTAVAPVDFTRLPFAVLIGAMFFGEWPDAVATAGMILVAASVLFISYREHRAKRRAATLNAGSE